MPIFTGRRTGLGIPVQPATVYYLPKQQDRTQMDLSFLLLRFLIGGGVIAGVTYLALQIDPKYGGILAAAPITTTLAFLFTFSGAGQETSRDLLISMFWFAIPTLFFILVLWCLIARYPLIPSLGGAFLFWLVAVIVMNRLLAGA